MLASQIPVKFNIPFANSTGLIQYPIPEASQIGITPGAASLTDGFPPLNFSPISSGGVPPRGVDFNGILNQISAWTRWTIAGGPIYYDPTFQAAIGGYPAGAIVQSAASDGQLWESNVDNNTSNPDAGGANWSTPKWAKNIGDFSWRPSSIPPTGAIICNGTTIGNAGSAATQIAASTLIFGYQYLWNNFSNTQCPVSGGRGANSTADFNALKTIGTLNMQGIGILGVDGMGGTPTGLLSGVPIVSGSATLAASILGENLHTLITAELAAHTHVNTLSAPTHTHTATTLNGAQVISNAGGTKDFGSGARDQVAVTQGFSIDAAVTGVAITNVSAGSGSAHNNVQRSMLGYWFMQV